MRINLVHLRIGIMTLQLLLAAGVTAFAGYRWYDLMESGAQSSVKIEKVSKFVMREGEADAGPRGAEKMRILPEWLMPQKPTIELPPPPPGDETTEDDPKDAPGDELGPGPLGEQWEYVFYIIRSDPLHNMVTLQKKDAAGAAAVPAAQPGGSSRAGARPRPTLRPSRVNLRKAGAAVQQATDRISFQVMDRSYENPDLQVELFYIHSADAEEFIYWMPADGPQKKYALKFVKPEGYSRHPEEGLRPAPKSEEEKAAEDADPKLPRFIKGPRDRESLVEKEYQDMLGGAPAGPLLQSGVKKDDAGEAGAGEGPAPPPESKVPSFGKRKEATIRKTITEDEQQQLRNVMKSPKMTAEDRAKLEKALIGAPKTK